MTEKGLLRQQVKAHLRELPPVIMERASAQARERLLQQPLWRRATAILFYAPLPAEIDIWPLLTEASETGKMVALPRYGAGSGAYVACQVRNSTEDIRVGQFGIREPRADCIETPLNRLDLVLVPGIAFDLHGRRLGRGRGHYDRLLAAVRGATCGVAFDEQIVRAVPVEPHDIHLDCILTPTRWIEIE
jgi:5-formyltetrahydrofolate cyclo-ligase